MIQLTKNVDFSELCITSATKIEKSKSDITSVVTVKAQGIKCPICWKINKSECERHPS